MPYFQEIEPFYEALETLFDRLNAVPEIHEKAMASNLVVNFKYENPPGEVWIDCSGDDMVFTKGPSELECDARLSMETDTAHRFWLGKVNLIKALTSEEIVSEGSVPKLLKLLPIVKPAYKVYPEILKEMGMEDIVDVD